MVRRILIAATLVALCGSAHAQLVNNPSLFPSASLQIGNCLQATGPNTVASTGSPCGSGTGSGNVSGPTSSIIGDIATWSNGTGTGLADSGVPAASIPFLGANNLWGGLNTFQQRPLFGTATPWDSSNFNPANYLTIVSAAATYLTIANAASTYATIANSVTPAQLALKANIASPTFTGIATSPAYTLNASPGVFKPISFNSAGTQRWQIGGDNAGEGGSNTGTNFAVFAYTDQGAVLSQPLNINRASGVAAFNVRPTFAGFTPYDTGNLPTALTTALAPYLQSSTAASTYLTQANAAATYTTPAEVDAALASFLTIANAAATYMTPAQVATALVPYATNANVAATYATIAGVQSAYLRISDAAATYLTLANAALTYLTQQSAAAAYFPFSGGTVTGPTQFNQIPVLNASIPPVTDSSGDVASSSWVQAVITSRVGTNGPYIPLTGVGMPYDVSIPYQGLNVPVTPYPSAFNVLTYVFARKVTFPINFGSPQVTCQSVPTNTTVLTVSRQGSVAGVIGSVTFTHANCKSLFSIASAQTFLPGDTLEIFTNQSAGNPAIADPTLGGISGTIPGTIAP